jgi:hypothetical protein
MVKKHEQKSCQPELVEGGFIYADRLRQAQPDTSTIANFYHLKELKNIFICIFSDIKISKLLCHSF